MVNKVNGKTYSAIKFVTKQKLAYNYKIITNIKSFNTFKDTIYIKDFMEIIRYCTKFKNNDENVIILFDEIFTLIEKNKDVQAPIRSFLSQLRKRNIILVTTAQEWSEINITFRRYCRYQIDCNMFAIPVFNYAFIYNVINDGYKVKWSNELQEHIAPRISANFAKCNKSIIDSYDTFETI